MSKKKLCILAHYYAPDTASTGQILKEQAEGMLDAFDITVICVVPSYDGNIPKQYVDKKYYFEELNGVKVVRVRVPAFSKTNKFSRVKNILTYFFGVLFVNKKIGHMDYIFTISQPPILGGILGVIYKWINKAKLIYCIQDFNPEQIMAIGYSKSAILLWLMMKLDKYSCKKADLIVMVGRDMADTLIHRFRGKKIPKHIIINNWIDEKVVYPLDKNHPEVLAYRKEYGLENKFVIMYSGNIGLYYNFESIMHAIKSFRKGYTSAGLYENGPVTKDGREVVFAFVGAGALLETIKTYVKKHHMENVVFIPYQDKRRLIYSLNAGDVHWCINAKGIKGVSCPSKAYGIMGVGKPILGVLEEGTEIRTLVEESNCGLCCNPEDEQQICKLIEWYIDNACEECIVEMGLNGRKHLENYLTKDISIQKYIDAIYDIV